MTDDELINDLVSRIAKGEITFDKIRPMLEERGLDELRIKQIVRKVDDEIQQALVTKSTSSSVDQVIRIGVILLVVGAVLTIGSFAGLFSLQQSYLVIFAYGPLIAGLVLIVGGVRRKKKNLTQGSDTLNRNFRLRSKMKNEE
ncbi:MAG TPA: hypothetical protein VIU13_10025 [Chryseolinea sp.]